MVIAVCVNVHSGDFCMVRVIELQLACSRWGWEVNGILRSCTMQICEITVRTTTAVVHY